MRWRFDWVIFAVLALAGVLATSCVDTGWRTVNTADVDAEADIAVYEAMEPSAIGYVQGLAEIDAVLQQTDAAAEDLARAERVLDSLGLAYARINWPVSEIVYYRRPEVLAERVRITEIMSYNYGEDQYALFRFSDARAWERITRYYSGSRIAIGLNGRIVMAPSVMGPIRDGACSVWLDDAHVRQLTGGSVRPHASWYYAPPQMDTDKYLANKQVRTICLLLIAGAYVLVLILGIWSARVRRLILPGGVIFFLGGLLIIDAPFLIYIFNPRSLILGVAFLFCVANIIGLIVRIKGISCRAIKSREDVQRRTRSLNVLIYLVVAALSLLCLTIDSSRYYCSTLVSFGDAGSWVESIGKFAFFFTIAVVLADGFIRQICSRIYTTDIIDELEKYNLYLRSFEADSSPRSEKMICGEFGRLYETYAIGNPNTVLQPLGVRRIYASDNEWQEAVSRLMEGARIIIMRCAETGGAMWEINRLFSRPELLAKCVWIVDSPQVFGFLTAEFRRHNIPVIAPTLDFDASESYGIVLEPLGAGYRLGGQPLATKADVRKLIDKFMEVNGAVRQEYAAARKMRNLVFMKILSDEIPKPVRRSLNWGIISPFVNWRHWPLWSWSLPVLCFVSAIWTGPVLLVVYILFMFLFGNRIEWAQRPSASPRLFLRRQRREALMMWAPLLFTLAVALLVAL